MITIIIISSSNIFVDFVEFDRLYFDMNSIIFDP